MRAKVDYYFGCAVRHFGGVLCGVVKSVVFCVILAVWCTRASRITRVHTQVEVEVQVHAHPGRQSILLGRHAGEGEAVC